MKFSTNDFFSKCDQISRKIRIWSHLLKNSLMKNFILSAVNTFQAYNFIIKRHSQKLDHFLGFNKCSSFSWIAENDKAFFILCIILISEFLKLFESLEWLLFQKSRDVHDFVHDLGLSQISMMEPVFAKSSIIDVWHAPKQVSEKTLENLAICDCDLMLLLLIIEQICHPNPCLNDGQCLRQGDTYKCVCTPQFKGYHCESTSIWI